MVGVPTSNGCATCRKRSIKCDERRPSCSQCSRGGRRCPGFARSPKFIDETPRIRAKHSKTAMLSTATFRPPSPHHSDIERNQIVTSFICDLFPLAVGPIQHSYIGGWLWMIPTVMNQQSTLDLAAEALACIYFAKKARNCAQKSHEVLMRGHAAYLRALGDLSRALRHQRYRLSLETLCATLLLVQYERFSSRKGRSWLSHAHGVGQLIKIRGPARHNSSMAHAVLMASRGYVISEALITGKSCFLEQEDWQNVQLVDQTSQLIPSNVIPHHTGMNLFARAPGLVQQSRALKYPVDLEDPTVQSLRSRTSQLRSEMLDWYTKAGIAMKRVLRVEPSNPNHGRPYYHYDGSISASFAVNYCAYLILLNNILDLVSGYCSHKDANKDLATDISLSASYCFSAGFCGSQAMMLTLPIALTALSEKDPVYEHVQECLRSIDDPSLPLEWNAKVSGEA